MVLLFNRLESFGIGLGNTAGLQAGLGAGSGAGTLAGFD